MLRSPRVVRNRVKSAALLRLFLQTVAKFAVKLLSGNSRVTRLPALHRLYSALCGRREYGLSAKRGPGPGNRTSVVRLEIKTLTGCAIYIPLTLGTLHHLPHLHHPGLIVQSNESAGHPVSFDPGHYGAFCVGRAEIVSVFLLCVL